MLVNEYFSALCEDISAPCLVAELESNVILYYNQVFSDMLPKKVSLLSETLNTLFQENGVTFPHKFPNTWKQSQVIELEILTPIQQVPITLICTRLDFNGKGYNLVKFKRDSNLSFETAITRCISIFEEPHTTMLDSLMEITGKHYHSQRAYVYRVDQEHKTIRSSAHWCEDPLFKISEDVDTVLDGEILLDWAALQPDLVVLDKNSKNFPPQSIEHHILSTFGLDNCTISFLRDHNENIIGIVGFSNSNKYVSDFRLLKVMTRIVAQNINQITIEHVKTATLTDKLTGFLTRDQYAKMVESLVENPPSSLGLLSVHVNGLKEINSNLGYSQGDEYISSAANLLKNHFTYPFYRLSGAEIVGFAPNIDKELFEQQVKSLYLAMKEDNDYSFSVGQSWAKDVFNINSLLQEAETSMCINQQEYYHVVGKHSAKINNKILEELLKNLEKEEFVIYLQPQVRLKDGSLHGAEALVRRIDANSKKIIYPDQFITLYEQNSVIRHLDLFVVESVCEILSKWYKLGKNIPISVNLSRVTLQEYGIVNTIVDICDRHNIPHVLLVIEVTERVGLIENNVASSLITDFKEQGFNISLDDFGCAYSNIVTLAQIEVDEVKIDKSLVDEVTTSRKNHILVKNVLSMCNELEGASTLVEGIENVEQADLLYELGCHLGQGYYYSRPISVEEFFEKYINI